MQIVNPREGQYGEDIQLEEPFMLWCPLQKKYHTAIARLWADACGGCDSDDIVVGSAQEPNRILKYFTVGNSDNYGNDLFKTMADLLLLFRHDKYYLSYK